ncbi:MAG: VCBS repeat-containing protein [Actinomycetes bacterium]
MQRRLVNTLASTVVLGACALASLPAAHATTSPEGIATGPWGLTSTDINGDGRKDLIVATGGGKTVRVLMNNFKTDGTALDPTKPVLIPGDPGGSGGLAQGVTAGVATADLNGDGNQEILVADAGYDRFTTLSADSGNGALSPYSVTPVIGKPPIEFQVGATPTQIKTGDLNKDGCTDAVTVNIGTRDFGVFLGMGSNIDAMDVRPPSAFNQIPAHPQTFKIPHGLVLGDFNGDGKLDMASANSGDRTVSIQTNTGNDKDTSRSCPKDPTSPYDAKTNPRKVGAPMFKSTSIGSGFGPVDLAGADFNGDGLTDLVTASPLTGQGIFINSVKTKTFVTTFKQTPFFSLGLCGVNPVIPQAIAAGDWNGDRLPDVAFSDPGCDRIVVMINLGKGKFSLPIPVSLPAGSAPTAITFIDVNSDGKQELAVSLGDTETVAVLLSKGTCHGPAVKKSPLPDCAAATLGTSVAGTPSADLELLTGASLIQTGALLNVGPVLLTPPPLPASQTSSYPVLTDATNDCASPAYVPILGSPACRPSQGDEIDTTDGIWAGSSAADDNGASYTFTYTWQRSTAGIIWTTIPGQKDVNTPSYTTTRSDSGNRIRACVTAYSGQAGARVPSVSPACAVRSTQKVK